VRHPSCHKVSCRSSSHAGEAATKMSPQERLSRVRVDREVRLYQGV
jgi:hypothetical protein